ncbi:MAG: hypothetical protein ACR2K2_08285 [Mycobacteriales bacterium]
MTPRLLVLLPALALALTACGGNADPKADYVAKANSLCADADDDFAALTQPTSAAEFSPFAQKTVAIAEKAQRELAKLSPPEQDRAELETKVLTPFAALVEEGKAFAQQVSDAGADQAKLLALLPQRPTAEKIDLGFLRSYGLGTCADAIELGT